MPSSFIEPLFGGAYKLEGNAKEIIGQIPKGYIQFFFCCRGGSHMNGFFLRRVA
jgi:hypothetical protein